MIVFMSAIATLSVLAFYNGVAAPLFRALWRLGYQLVTTRGASAFEGGKNVR